MRPVICSHLLEVSTFISLSSVMISGEDGGLNVKFEFRELLSRLGIGLWCVSMKMEIESSLRRRSSG